MSIVIQLVTAFLGSLAFCGIFNLEKSKLLLASFGAFLSWGIYLLLGLVLPSDAFRFLIATFCVGIYAEIMARIKKTPTTLFIVPATFPLIPGGSLYKTMRYAVQGQRELCFDQAIYTLKLAAAIAVGMILAMTLWRILMKMQRKEIRS